MKQYSYFECSVHLSQLEARLEKNGYLSKGNLPNSADAKVFLMFQDVRKIPSRKTHPNLYHWYIVMKQFSLRTVQIWQQQAVSCEQDKFVNDYVKQQTKSLEKENSIDFNNSTQEDNSSLKYLKPLPFLSTPKGINKCLKNQEFLQNSANRPITLPTSLKLIPSERAGLNSFTKGQLSSPVFDKQYVMQMQLKQSSSKMYGLKQRLQQQKLQLINFQVDQNNIRVVFRAEADEYQRLKDRISQWQQISNLRFRKQKRFNIKNENKSQKIILSNDISLAMGD